MRPDRVSDRVPVEVRRSLVASLRAGSAHRAPSEIMAGWPRSWWGVRPPGCAHSAWEVIEHMRIVQRDILMFCEDPRHVSPAWPKGYWPKSTAPKRAEDWRKSVMGFRRDLKRLIEIVEDRTRDLVAPLPHAKNVTWVHELLLVVSHNAYHACELAHLRRCSRV